MIGRLLQGGNNPDNPLLAGFSPIRCTFTYAAHISMLGPGGNSGGCTDENTSCERWATLGECTKNPEYMVGSAEVLGACRRSCKVC
ncbi:probable prolyl 4-hydroxylase 4 [Magnolia sinica]|uniref:probable prolyl 4-hydroxylase 4 n=1 Tax=Magnolia sinica TaxID=86752 RepID=UPI002658AA42|nr:probable prolyl 4-hydroxylase 4 [Magnolia sinica]